MITLLLRLFIKYNVVIEKLILVLAYSYIVILIKYIKLLIRDNFIFESTKGYLVVLFTLVIDLSFYIVLVRNNSNKSINLSSKLYINFVIDVKANRYYYLDNFKEV